MLRDLPAGRRHIFVYYFRSETIRKNSNLIDRGGGKLN